MPISTEAEWLTRKKRIDTKLRALNPPWQIIPWHDGPAPCSLTFHAVTEFPIANEPADYTLFVNGILRRLREQPGVLAGIYEQSTPRNNPVNLNVSGVTRKDRSLAAAHFEEFEKSCGRDPNSLSKRTDGGDAGRFRKFQISDIQKRGYKLDVTWLKDNSPEDSDELPEPQELAGKAITELGSVMDDLREIIALLEREEGVEK